ncbi:MAG: restriction endonuclease [Candidatus Thorarchaeota archaeon]
MLNKMRKTFKLGHNYKDILSVSREDDQFVSWFSYNKSGIGNSGGIRSAKYIHKISDLPCYIVLITRNISHRWYNPWEDTVDYASGKIYYWGDAKYDKEKSYSYFRGNRILLKTFEKILDSNLNEIPPILHFTKVKSGLVKFSGLCILSDLSLTWFEDRGVPVKNYRCELTILDTDHVNIDWLHYRVNCSNIDKLNDNAPKIWRNYIKGNINKLDVWSRNILKKEDQLPLPDSSESKILNQLVSLSSVEFEAIVVELFLNLPYVSNKIYRTRPTADGGFDFYGKFSIPYPLKYEIDFLGEAKKFSRDNAVQPKHVSRLVARLGRGQFGVFVTTSYYTIQTQKEVLEDGYPVRLFSGLDLVNILHELRLVENDQIKSDWLTTVIEKISESLSFLKK